MDVALVVDLAEVAGDEEAVAAEFGLGLLRHPPVALEHVRALDLDHADGVPRELLAGLGIGDPHRDAGQREADGARHAIALIGVRRIHVGLGHAVALEHGMAGACRPFAMGVGEQRRRARDEQPHMLGGVLVQAGVLQQAGIEGRHAHHHGGAGHQLQDHVRIELRQEDHRGAREQRDVARHEQAVGVIDRQGVDQHVLVGEAPVVDQRIGVRGEIVVRQHRALGAAGGA